MTDVEVAGQRCFICNRLRFRIVMQQGESTLDSDPLWTGVHLMFIDGDIPEPITVCPECQSTKSFKQVIERLVLESLRKARI